MMEAPGWSRDGLRAILREVRYLPWGVLQDRIEMVEGIFAHFGLRPPAVTTPTPAEPEIARPVRLKLVKKD